ncbi:Ribosome assembly protein rrb1 [Savitreella phatthalungensis]
MSKRPAEESLQEERPEDLFSDDDDYESDSSEDIIQASDSENEMDEELPSRVWLPGTQLAKDEMLEPDMTAYEMLHSVNAKWPCLTFDTLWDTLGDERRTYPATTYFVTGTQADRPERNEIQVVRCSNLTRSAGDESDSEDDDEDPVLAYKAIPLTSGVNRIRATQTRDTPHLVAALQESGTLGIYNVEEHLQALNADERGSLLDSKPIHTYSGSEGFALDWSNGRLVHGDNDAQIFLSEAREGGFATGSQPFRGHDSSVEDLQWSPNERTVFASCSSDGTFRVWDTRSKKRAPAVTVKAHSCDVNVMSWNSSISYLLATGADDGRLSVWDLRALSEASPVATFDWHKSAITSIGWHPKDESVLAAAGADDQTTIWDLSVELDAEEQAAKHAEGLGDVPSQLMFVHMGQQDVKELRWLPQLPGVLATTAATGFNIFKSAHQN